MTDLTSYLIRFPSGITQRRGLPPIRVGLSCNRAVMAAPATRRDRNLSHRNRLKGAE